MGQSRSGRGGEEKNSQSLLGLEPSIIQPDPHNMGSNLTYYISEFVEKNFIQMLQ
jgi:hypothetical protein